MSLTLKRKMRAAIRSGPAGRWELRPTDREAPKLPQESVPIKWLERRHWAHRWNHTNNQVELVATLRFAIRWNAFHLDGGRCGLKYVRQVHRYVVSVEHRLANGSPANLTISSIFEINSHIFDHRRDTRPDWGRSKCTHSTLTGSWTLNFWMQSIYGGCWHSIFR